MIKSGGMDQSVEVAAAAAVVVAEWRGTEALGLTLGRDLRIEEVEPSVGAPARPPKWLLAGWAVCD
eukprot:COSAG02_NODE_66_length_42609_cov_95.996848_34_plen_66_part_00